MADEAGELVAERYRVLTRVGQGAMGVVWRAEDERLRREVALKQVWLPAGADEQARDQAHRRVFREGRMIARLHHPQAITVFDVVEHDGRPWLVMEYLPSRSLSEVLVGDGPLDPDRAARVGRQVAEALAAAHDAGIVHRDVKPGNVLLADDGRAKVTDFGIARAVDDVTITSTGMMAGTPAYLAPEVARGADADFRSDVYSLGSTLYAALEGAPPYGTGDNPLAVLHRVASGEYNPLAHRGPITPLVEQMLRADPAHRPDMHRVAADLARLLSAGAGTEEGPVTPFLTRPEQAPVSSASVPPVASAPSWTAPSVPSGSPSGPPSGPPPVTRPGPTSTGPAAASAVASASGPVAPLRRDGHGSAAVAAPPAAAPDTRPATTAPVGAPAPSGPGIGGSRDDGAPDDEQGRGRRWPWVLAVAAVVAVVAAIGLAAWLSTSTDPPTASVPGSTAAPEASGTATPEAGSGSGGGSSAAAPVAGSPEEQARQQAVIDYYALLPDRLDESWQRLTPSFQQSTAGGFGSYRGFWGSMDQVTVRGVSPAGGDEVDATVTYRYTSGREVDERTVFRMVQEDGIWKIDGQRQAR
ncbi:serine/threonine-protein kinase [Actinomycetospora sp. CA-101289]|uniref:serine/threonine-protein kinase n=1 Tax=Actinomycetospora sp. CA-101289 TaxID=3239893 RepID=UPI003D9771B1